MIEGPTIIQGYAGEELKPGDFIVTCCIYCTSYFKTWNTFSEHMAEDHPEALQELYDYEVILEIKKGKSEY